MFTWAIYVQLYTVIYDCIRLHRNNVTRDEYSDLPIVTSPRQIYTNNAPAAPACDPYQLCGTNAGRRSAAAAGWLYSSRVSRGHHSRCPQNSADPEPCVEAGLTFRGRRPVRPSGWLELFSFLGSPLLCGFERHLSVIIIGRRSDTGTSNKFSLSMCIGYISKKDVLNRPYL